MTTCAIVGNAKSIFGKGHGELIDSHDVVIRINQPGIISVLDQGSKTDIIVVHDLTKKYANPKQHRVVNSSTDLRVDLEEWSKIIEAATGIERARPTTGFMAILYARALDWDINLFGFDWYETPTYYQEQLGPWKRHSPSWEKKQIREWLNTQSIY